MKCELIFLGVLALTALLSGVIGSIQDTLDKSRLQLNYLKDAIIFIVSEAVVFGGSLLLRLTGLYLILCYIFSFLIYIFLVLLVMDQIHKRRNRS